MRGFGGNVRVRNMVGKTCIHAYETVIGILLNELE